MGARSRPATIAWPARPAAGAVAPGRWRNVEQLCDECTVFERQKRGGAERQFLTCGINRTGIGVRSLWVEFRANTIHLGVNLLDRNFDVPQQCLGERGS